MARPISADAMAIIATGPRFTSECTITVPTVIDSEEAAEPVVVTLSPGWAVTERAPVAGPRLGIPAIKLLPTDNIDNLFELVDTPGARVQIREGIVLGADIEWITVFTGYVVEDSAVRDRLGVTVSLSDGWGWFDPIPFEGEHVTVVGEARSTCIIDLVTPVIEDVETVVEATGGYIETEGVYTAGRGQAAAEMARDGLLQAGFNGDGQLVIRPQADTSGPFTPDWYFRTDQDPALPVVAAPTYPPTIVKGTLERFRSPLSRAINAVTVKPTGSEQTWTAQTVRLEDTLDPRHESKIGYRAVEITSTTIATACEAWLLAEAELVRRLRGTGERVRLQVLLNPAIEADDICWVAAMPTLDDAGWNGTYIITSVTHSPDLGTTSIEAMAAASFELTA